MIDAARRLLAGALDVPPDTIGPQTRLGVVPQWDSLAHMRLVLAIEDLLGRQLAPHEILSIDGLDTVAAIVK